VASGSLAPRYRVSNVRYRAKHTISKTSISNDHSISTFFTFDIVYRYWRCSISKVTRFDIEGDIPSISNVIYRTVRHCRYRSFVSSISNIIIRYRALISYTISKAFLTFHIEYESFDIKHLNIGIDIVYDIAFTRCHSLRSGSSLYPGGITPAPKGLRATRPGFLHPLFVQFHSLIHRDLTRKVPSIAPHPHVDFEQPAPSPVVGS
jgi:hypothetical protein